jgi:hypothetical protein
VKVRRVEHRKYGEVALAGTAVELQVGEVVASEDREGDNLGVLGKEVAIVVADLMRRPLEPGRVMELRARQRVR